MDARLIWQNRQVLRRDPSFEQDVCEQFRCGVLKRGGSWRGSRRLSTPSLPRPEQCTLKTKTSPKVSAAPHPEAKPLNPNTAPLNFLAVSPESGYQSLRRVLKQRLGKAEAAFQYGGDKGRQGVLRALEVFCRVDRVR